MPAANILASRLACFKCNALQIWGFILELQKYRHEKTLCRSILNDKAF